MTSEPVPVAVSVVPESAHFTDALAVLSVQTQCVPVVTVAVPVPTLSVIEPEVCVELTAIEPVNVMVPFAAVEDIELFKTLTTDNAGKLTSSTARNHGAHRFIACRPPIRSQELKRIHRC